jgi:hypothetical protein
MFAFADFDQASRTIKFGRGGFQGSRPGGAEEYFVHHVREELDYPNEVLYNMLHITSVPLDDQASVFLFLPTAVLRGQKGQQALLLPQRQH